MSENNEKRWEALIETTAKLQGRMIVIEEKMNDVNKILSAEFAKIFERLEPIEWHLQYEAEMPIEVDDHFIKLTANSNDDDDFVYIKVDAISGIYRIKDIEPYTKVFVGDGHVNVKETPEQIMKSLGYKKNEE